MKLQNITGYKRELRDRGQVIVVEPFGVIEVTKPLFNNNTFKIIEEKEIKEYIEKKIEENTLNIVKKTHTSKKEKMK
jgi:5,10-methenyltetrahydromethanopterin hydrogenase